jgi:hypothetical protein
MCAAWDSSSVPLPDFIRTTTFRWTLAAAGMFAAEGFSEVRLAAVVHDFRFTIAAGPGCTAEIARPQER